MFKDLTKLIPLLLLSGGLGFTSCLSLGCNALKLSGAGEFTVGLRNENLLVFGHTTDGDKQNNAAKVEIEFDPLLKTVLGLGGEAESEGGGE